MAQKEKRLTDQLSLALASASAAVAVGKSSPEHAQRGCKLAEAALNEANEILVATMRAAESI